MEKEWHEMSQAERIEYCRTPAAAMGITPEAAAEILDAEIRKSARAALESASDPNIPADIMDVAMLIEAASGQKVSSIQEVTGTGTWALVTPGNPIIMEDHARALGYPKAFSDRPGVLLLRERAQ